MERFEGRPFAIVGVNAGDSEEAFREGLEEYGLTWISAYQGAVSEISELYLVDGYPTLLLIDHEGKIVYRGHHLGDDDVLERHVKAAEESDE